MLQFKIAEERCTSCGSCVDDCPARIISLSGAYPEIAADKEANCLRCQHCLTICPTGAVSIFGLDPDQSQPLDATSYPEPEKLASLVLGRRSFRHYKDENVDRTQLDRLLGIAAAAPTGVNARPVNLYLIDDKAVMARFKAQAYACLRDRAAAGTLPTAFPHFARFADMWFDKGVDILFRGAPHFMVAAGPARAPTPVQDGIISLATFELLAQAEGLGTVWGGLAFNAINDIAPELRSALGIPADYVIAYTLIFGKPAIDYARTVQRGQPAVHRVA